MELRLEKRKMKIAPLGEESCVPDLFGEVIIQNQLRFHLGEEEELYEGYGRVESAYPYRQRNGYSRKLKEEEVQTAVLENSLLKAVFLTGYGGRLWELWDKATGKNLLYTNDILRFSNLAVRNAWFSGGIEWNIGIIGHTPFTTEPLYIARTETESGVPVLRMYEYERIRDVTYQMDFWLEEESPGLNCRIRIVNEKTEIVPMYWWSNIAVPEFEGGRVIVPAKSAYTCTEKLVHKVEIPLVGGIDITDYKKIPKSVDYFFELEEDSPKYIANVDKDGYGLLQLSTARLRSRKLFSWGNQAGSNHWQEYLTENAGRYLEIQAGLAKTQYGCLPMAPNTAWEWMEQYRPVQLEEGETALSHEERSGRLTDRLRKEQATERLEALLKVSKPMALTQAELLLAGSGYGILGIHGKLTSHLEFKDEEGSCSRWKSFLEGERLHCPNPEKRPDVFLDDKESLERLIEAVEGKEKKNWYAYYQLGVRYCTLGKYKKAEKAFIRSLELEKNAWALHGLACVEQRQNRNQDAIRHMLKGMKLQQKELSYLKEGFKLLLACEGYEELCTCYEKLEKDQQENGRLKVCYIAALGQIGKAEQAYQLMEADGGLVLDDVREGEDCLGVLWSRLHELVYHEKGEIPYRYQFMAFQ